MAGEVNANPRLESWKSEPLIQDCSLARSSIFTILFPPDPETIFKRFERSQCVRRHSSVHRDLVLCGEKSHPGVIEWGLRASRSVFLSSPNIDETFQPFEFNPTLWIDSIHRSNLRTKLAKFALESGIGFPRPLNSSFFTNGEFQALKRQTNTFFATSANAYSACARCRK